MVYLVTYDLNKVGKNYNNLYLALKQYNFIRDPGLDSVWFVYTSWTAAQIYEHLRHHLDVNDRIFITAVVKNNNFGWMHKDVWAWINPKL